MAVAGEKDAADVQALVQGIERLRKSYERYFSGIDKLEPQVERRRIQRELDRLTHSPITNTQVRFQLAQAKGRLITLQGHWNRVLLQIERGTYRRDRFLLGVKDRNAQERAAPATGPAPPKAKGMPAEPLSDELVGKLHRAYIYAKEKCNEPTEGISAERLQASLAKQVARMRTENPGAKPEFKVVIRDGKARIIARRNE